MKKLFLLIFTFLFITTAANAVDDFNAPVPAYDDEVTNSGPNTKISQSTQMRFDAFQEAPEFLDYQIPEDRKVLKLYMLSDNQEYLQKVKIHNAKVIEYTNGSYDIKFKDTPFTVFNYDKDGVLQNVIKITNKAKAPCYAYYYNVNGHIQAIEIRPEKYRAYLYDLEGILTKYLVDDKVYAPNGKLILRRKSCFL